MNKRKIKLNFVKIEGGGNDFILFDIRGLKKNKLNFNKISQFICRRKTGIGADGVLLIEKDNNLDFTMRIFNPDGSEVEMCGNGARCSAYYFGKKESIKEMRFNTLAGNMRAKIIRDNNIRLSLPTPTDTELGIIIDFADNQMSVSYINTGVPHVIVRSNKIDELDVEKIGKNIRFHMRFAPEGANVDFVEAIDNSTIKVRTYERGVEEETLACGTGAIASAIIESLKGKVNSPVRVLTKGGQIMKVYFKKSNEPDLLSSVYDVALEGKVNKVFEGIAEI